MSTFNVARVQTQSKPKGLVLYHGPSRINRQTIVVIATGIKRKSRNRKTGAMVQVWILVADEHPLDAVRSDADKAICGDCPLRGVGCYVEIGQAPAQIWKSWQAGSYVPYNPTVHLPLFTGRTVRFGAYGDPAAVPLEILLPIMQMAKGTTGYTHQWRKRYAQAYRPYLMASVGSVDEGQRAVNNGWRYFRCGFEPNATGERTCRAVAGKVQCDRCLLCSGARKPLFNITIPPHGGRAVMNYWNKLATSTN